MDENKEREKNFERSVDLHVAEKQQQQVEVDKVGQIVAGFAGTTSHTNCDLVHSDDGEPKDAKRKKCDYGPFVPKSVDVPPIKCHINNDDNNVDNALEVQSETQSNCAETKNYDGIRGSTNSNTSQTINKVPSLTVLHLYKHTPDSRLGLILTNNEAGTLTIKSCNKEASPLSLAPVQNGYEMLCINNMSCHNLTGKQAMETLRSQRGYFTLQFRPVNTCTDPHKVAIFLHSHCQRLGIKCRDGTNPPQVESIEPGGLIAKHMKVFDSKQNNSFWLVNDTIDSVNQFNDSEQIKQTLETAPTLNIILSRHKQNMKHDRVDESSNKAINTFSVSVVKKVAQVRLGISLVKDGKNNRLRVQNPPTGLLLNSGIQPGLVLLKINDIDCGDTSWVVADANAMLKSFVGKLNLLFELPNSPYSYTSITVFKTEELEKLGIVLYADHGQIRIKKRPGRGLFYNCGTIEMGQPLLRVNQHFVLNWHVDDVIAILRSLNGYITIVLGNTNNKTLQSDNRQVVVRKRCRSESLGLVLRNRDDDASQPLFISNIVPNSILWEHNVMLRIGDVIDSINNYPMYNVPAHAARSLIVNAPDIVSIVTRKQMMHEVKDSTISQDPQLANFIDRHPKDQLENVAVQPNEEPVFPLTEPSGYGNNDRIALEQQPRRTQSYIRSLPEVDASLELNSSNYSSSTPVVATVTDMELLNVTNLGLRLSNSDDCVYSTLPDNWPKVQEQPRPGLMAAQVYKNEANARLGITVVEDPRDGSIVVKKVAEKTLLSAASFLPGDTLIRINDWFVHGWTVQQVVRSLRELVGLVTIVVETPHGDKNCRQVMVCKSTPSDRLGIVFKNFDRTEGGFLAIGKVNPGGLLMGQKSILRSGDCIVSINDVPVLGCRASAAKEIATNAPDVVSIVTISPDMVAQHFPLRNVAVGWSSIRCGRSPMAEATALVPDHVVGLKHPPSVQPPAQNTQDHPAPMQSEELPGLISVRVVKPIASTRLGICLSNDRQRGLTIQYITNYGLLSQTPLKQGYRLLSINNQRCDDWSSAHAIQILKDLCGSLTIVARDDIIGNPSYVEATTMKLVPQGSVGVKFATQGGRLKISQILPNGLFVDSVLNSGDFILSINGVPSQNMTAADAVTEVQRSIQMVTFFAKSLHSTAVVVSDVSGYGEQLPVATNTNYVNQQQQSDLEQLEEEQKQQTKTFFMLIVGLIVVVSIIVASSNDSDH